MRHLIAAMGASLTLFVATEAKAQYATTYLPPLPPGYVYAYPDQATYTHSYQSVVLQYTRPPNRTGYMNRPYYGAYGYGFNSNGSTDGFPPFQPRRYRNR